MTAVRTGKPDTKKHMLFAESLYTATLEQRFPLLRQARDRDQSS
jgi:hypothetical protein